MRFLPLALAVAAGGLTVHAAAQNTLDWPTGMIEPYALDSGQLANEAAVDRMVFQDFVHAPDALWLRLYFGEVELSVGSFIRVTSLLDNEVQELDAQTLAMWGNTSAYFNGDTVMVELVAAEGSPRNRLVIDAIGKPAPPPEGDPGQCGICGGSDDRVPSFEDFAARLLPAGCTATVYNADSCMVSAGHCISGSMVVHFNVPESNSNCSINNPPVADQFPILVTDSVNGGVGNDWAVLLPGTNNLGELPYERYGLFRPIAGSVPSSGTAEFWGYGVDTTCTLSQTQQTADGPIVGLNSSTIFYEVDLRGGNSGSSIMTNDEIIGIVTHCNSGGCPGGGPNIGTRIDLAAFVAARDDLCGESLLFSFPDGRPDLVAPSGGTTMRVLVQADSATPQPGTGMLHVSVDGGPFVASSMTENAPNDYDAVFPSLSCASIVQFYVSAETTSALTLTSPKQAPDQSYLAVGGDSATSKFDDDFETDQGWTVSTSASDGGWNRGVPIPLSTCNRGNPGTDGDGSGQCYLTDNSAANACNSDVDSGDTILTSPTMDASDPDSVISYWRWFSNTAGSAPGQDIFEVEISDNGGSSWTNLETVGPSTADSGGGWFHLGFRVGDFVANTSSFRIRFIASDTDPQSVVEAAVDGVLLRNIACGGGQCGDGNVDPGEDCANCPADVPCPPGTECVAGLCEDLCGNGSVDPGEDCENCPADVQCPPGTECVAGMCEDLCGNGSVDPGEDCTNCPADVQCGPDEECVAGICQPLCGNGTADPGEDCTNCPADVPCGPDEECVAGVCEPLCGNGNADPGEDCASCPADVPCGPGEDCVAGVCEPGCAADLDGDGMVGIGDFLIVLGFWGGPEGDIDGDGTTGIEDFLLVIGNWGPCP